MMRKKLWLTVGRSRVVAPTKQDGRGMDAKAQEAVATVQGGGFDAEAWRAGFTVKQVAPNIDEHVWGVGGF